MTLARSTRSRISRRLFPMVLLAAGCGGFSLGGDDLGGSTDQARGGDLGGAVTASFSSLYGDYLGNCGSCHAPGAPGRTSDIESSLDFSSRTTAYTTLTSGMAAALTGPPMACNGVPFIAKGKPASSLALAVLDETVRTSFDLPSAPSCDRLSITDETVKVGSAPSTVFLASFRAWIQAGAIDD